MERQLFLSLITFICFIKISIAQNWEERPQKQFETIYEQDFTTNQWNGELLYNQWDAVQPNIFTASDIENGYLQFVWISKRILQSKAVYQAPYVFEAEISYEGGSNRGGLVLRIENNMGEKVQEPAQGDPGFNTTGLALYPTDDGDSLIVQFTGNYEKNNTPVTRIKVPKPEGLGSLKEKNTFRIEDYNTSIYVLLNSNPFVRIELTEKSGVNYISGNVYNSADEKIGSFSNMLVKENGHIAICQRDAKLRLYSAKISISTLSNQAISFDPISTKSPDDSPFKLNAVASSGLPVSYRVISGPAEITDDTLILSGGIGMVKILAIQEGNLEYYPAEAEQAFFVTNVFASVSSQDYVDNWVATDALGRQLPLYAEAGPKRNNKFVGVFYYTWNGAHGNKVYDITKILKNYPSDPLSADNNAWGPVSSFHFWGEPEYGYYHSKDPWVLRRDLQMLSNARVDFVFFDATNGNTYLDVVNAFCEMSMQMRAEGIYTPQIAFNTNKNPNTVNTLYNDFYSKNSYKDLWFIWDGKPLILGLKSDPDIIPQAKDFFTFKYSWAWTNSKNEPDHWQWLDKYPQDYGWSNDPSVPEQISVSVAHHPSNPFGKSYSNGVQPSVNSNYLCEKTENGLQFAEQWRRVFEVDPEVVMITQWNEWIAQRFLAPASKTQYAGRPMKEGDTYFVDVFTEEFNRDIAPMKGGYTDNYYYQMVSNIRKFKGMAEPPVVSTPKTINIDGDFDEWMDVTPVFKDACGDIMHRNFRGYDPNDSYVNTSGRNDIIESRVTYDSENIYFYVKTNSQMSPYTDPNWMLLFIDVDKNKATGWEGYDFVINHSVNSDSETTLKQFANNEWKNISTVTYSLDNNQMEIRVSRNALGLTNDTPEFYFHWADNPTHLNDISAFFNDGESAPDRRFNFNYSSTALSTFVQKQLEKQELLIYPNPANSELNIEFPFSGSKSARVLIYDSTGKMVINKNINRNLSAIEIEHLKAGMYFVKVVDKVNISIGKFVKN